MMATMTKQKPGIEQLRRYAVDELKLQYTPQQLRNICRDAMQADDPMSALRALVEVGALDADPTRELPAKPDPLLAKETNGRVSVHVEPLAGDEQAAYATRHVDVQIGIYHGEVLRRVLKGLRESGCKVATGPRAGRIVDSNADAVRWLLDQIGESTGIKRPTNA